MKYILLAILILQVNISTYCQDEIIIYKKIINEYTLKNKQKNLKETSITLIIIEMPRYMRKLDDNEFSRHKRKHYKNLDEKIFVDFIKMNQEGLNIEYFVKMNQEGIENSNYSDVNIVIINQEQSKNREELLTRYPNWAWNLLILEFSNIGFNENKTQALVYYGFDGGGYGIGGGFYIIFEKKRGKWKRKGVMPAWAA